MQKNIAINCFVIKLKKNQKPSKRSKCFAFFAILKIFKKEFIKWCSLHKTGHLDNNSLNNKAV
jgi:hypothetical protein